MISVSFPISARSPAAVTVTDYFIFAFHCHIFYIRSENNFNGIQGCDIFFLKPTKQVYYFKDVLFQWIIELIHLDLNYR